MEMQDIEDASRMQVGANEGRKASGDVGSGSPPRLERSRGLIGMPCRAARARASRGSGSALLPAEASGTGAPGPSLS